MLTNDEAINEVARSAAVLDATASSHWDGHEGERREYDLAKTPFDFSSAFTSFDTVGPVGAISRKTALPYRLTHRVLQIPFRIRGSRLREFRDFDRAAGTVARRQGRAYDGDLMRHTLTMALLRDRLDLSRDARLVAVIGDGFANMASLLLAGVPDSRVILVNLTKTLLLDLVFLRKAFPELEIALITNKVEMSDAVARRDIRILSLRADDAPLLAHAPVTLGINIKSMMEMDPPVTAAYFDALRRCPADRTAFYCCNRVEKIWADGTVIRFHDYPWDKQDVHLVDEPCPWDRYGYSRRPPFYHRRGGTVQHRLTYLKKIAAERDSQA